MESEATTKRRRLEIHKGIFVCSPNWQPPSELNVEDEVTEDKENASNLLMMLPDELRLRILSLLGIRDLLVLAQVCQGWKQLAEDKTLRPVFDFSPGNADISNTTQQLKALWQLFRHKVKFQVASLAFRGVVFNRSIHNFLQGQRALSSLCLSHCTKTTEALWDTIAVTCDTLTRLDVSYVDSLGRESLRELLKGLPLLTSLNVSSKGSELHLKDVFEMVADYACQLRRLDCCLPVVKTTKGNEEDSAIVARFGMTCTGLSYLALTASPELSAVIAHCTYLQELSIVVSNPKAEVYDALAMPHPLLADRLITLNFFFDQQPVPTGLVGMVSSKYPSLESLRVLPFRKYNKQGSRFLPPISLPHQELRQLFTPRLRAFELKGLLEEPQQGLFGDDVLEYIGNSCPQLETLIVGRTSVSDDGLNAFFNKATHLKSLHLESDKLQELVCQSREGFLEELQQLVIRSCRDLKSVTVCCKYLRELRVRDCGCVQRVTCEAKALEKCILRQVSNRQGDSPTVVKIFGGEKIAMQECEVGEVYVEATNLQELRVTRSIVRCGVGSGGTLSMVHPTLRTLELDVLDGETPDNNDNNKDNRAFITELHIQCPGMVKLRITNSTLQYLQRVVLKDMEYVSTTALELQLAQVCRRANKEISGCGGFVDWSAVD